MDTTVTATLKERLTGRVARYADRREDWSVFGFETTLAPRYARAYPRVGRPRESAKAPPR